MPSRMVTMSSLTDWLAQLEKMGYEDGQKWLAQNAVHLGKKSTYATPPAAGNHQGAIPPAP